MQDLPDLDYMVAMEVNGLHLDCISTTFQCIRENNLDDLTRLQHHIRA